MNVLSLFDGMSCGQIALEKAGIKVDNYFASELDKYAIRVTQHNYPKTKQLGDVTKVKYNCNDKIDLLIGGSPCQGFSFAGKQLNFNDPRSKLFFEYVRLLKETNPKYFLLENVKMKKEHENIITKLLGVKPIEINSSLFSAQNRVRLYWTNIQISTIKPLKITISDIVMNKAVGCARRARYLNGKSGKTYQKTELRKDDKANAMTTVKKNSMVFINNNVRYLYRKEAELLQNVPEHYTDCVSESQAFKMLGNGWTVDVIAHIFKGLKK